MAISCTRLRSISATTARLAALTLAGIAGPGIAFAAQEACPPDDEDDYYVCAKVSGGVEYFKMPKASYLARENLGTFQLQYDFFDLDEDLEGERHGVDLELGFRYPFLGGSHLLARVGYAETNASGNDHIGMIDVGTGYGLGIPGALGGPSGAFLPVNPANIIEDADYLADLYWHAKTINLENRFEDTPGLAYGYYGGIVLSRAEVDHVFTGVIPGYNSDFRYDTRMETEALGLHVGARGRRDIGSGFRGWQPQFSARAEVGLAFINADLHDRSSFGGILGGAVADSEVHLHDEATRPYFGVGGAIALNHSRTDTQFFLDVQYEQRPWFTKVERNGTDQTRFDFSPADVLSVTLGARYKF